MNEVYVLQCFFALEDECFFIHRTEEGALDKAINVAEAHIKDLPEPFQKRFNELRQREEEWIPLNLKQKQDLIEYFNAKHENILIEISRVEVGK